MAIDPLKLIFHVLILIMSFPNSDRNDASRYHPSDPDCAYYHHMQSSDVDRAVMHDTALADDVKLVDAANRVHEAPLKNPGNGKFCENDEQDDEEEEEAELKRQKYRRKSFSKAFPDIPALEFDSTGDVLDSDKPMLKIRAITWNIAGHHPKEDMTELLGLIGMKDESDSASLISELEDDDDMKNEMHDDAEPAPLESDLIFIGFQELSANPMAPVMNFVVMSEIWQATLKRRLAVRNYMMLQSIRLQGILLLVFCKSDHLRHIRSLETAYLRLGASGWWGNKGAVGISFDAYGKSICVINSHLSPHDHAFDDRVRNYRNILSDLLFPRRHNVSTILEHDFVIWMGDFNFRIEGITQDKTLYYVRTENFPKLLKHDQLRRAAFVEGAFSTFKEAKIRFPPTYKFVEGRRNIYDMRNPAKIRRPSYCDRVLWRSLNDSVKVQPLEYTSHMEHKISDHKPVTLTLQIFLGEGVEQFVTFDPIDAWYVGENGHFRYAARSGTHYSSWDWIGLYKVNHHSFNDYLTYVWSPGGGTENRGVINGRYLTRPGRFVLIYFSSEHKCGIGYSEPFDIRVRK
ncbi:inositol polyphosphate 5-phosphatase K-like isoform X2 [Paramacrobiotus metropolitanus]|uniref:inositol polyphosphate 5-phosphatase K-like isoform X2 n=1 Tax=Paramacrobiotus metropolitanus TaxID=2943436 RepID=UPI002445A08C|nr:inositol polyphosphate 5-phosphatase K-like isoform X2 [Paramacrobiotus metropolitanus]